MQKLFIHINMIINIFNNEKLFFNFCSSLLYDFGDEHYCCQKKIEKQRRTKYYSLLFSSKMVTN